MEEWIKKQWDKYQPEIIGGIIVTILLAIATGIWAIAQTWAGPLIIPLVLGVFALGLLATNQLHIIRERNKKGITAMSNEQIESTLRKWLDKRQYSSKHQITETDLFRFVAIDEQKRPINVMRPKDNPTVIRLILALNEDDLAKIPVENQENMRFRIGVEMARFGLLCNPSKPLYVHLDLLCGDLLTENVFLSALDKVRQSHVLMLAIIREVSAMSTPNSSTSKPTPRYYG